MYNQIFKNAIKYLISAVHLLRGMGSVISQLPIDLQINSIMDCEA